MGQNSKTVESMYAAFGRGDIPFVVGILRPDVIWNEAEGFIYADKNPYVGVDAVLNGVFARLGAEWDGFAAVPHQIVDGGETVVALGRYTGKCKATGVKVDAQFVHVFRFKDGKIASFQQYTDTAQFQNAVSLRLPSRAH
jgi:ketosteroid isomerase-like protein